MSFKFVFTARFKKDFKSLSKRNLHLQSDLSEFLETFVPQFGTIIPETSGARKIRMKSTGKGKRSSYRIIYYYFSGDNVLMITMYSKNQKEDLDEDSKRLIRYEIETFKLKS